MPAPSSPFSTDHYLYKMLYEPAAAQICFIHPNYITGAALLMTVPIVMALLYRWTLGPLLLLIAIRTVLDCMDGAVARACDLKSPFGSLFDHVTDNVFNLAVVTTVAYMVAKRSGFVLGTKTCIAVAVCLVTLVGVLYSSSLIEADQNMNSQPTLFVFLHDNMLLSMMLYGCVAWWLANRF